MEEVLAILRYTALEFYDDVVQLVGEGRLALELLEKPQAVVARACDASGTVILAQEAPSKREAVRRLFEHPAFLY